MSDTRRQDPLRRTPPTIDLKAQSVPDKRDGPSAPADEGATSIEPVAATGLGVDPFTKGGAEPANKGAGAGDSVAPKPVQTTASKGAETTKPNDPKADAKPAGAKPAPASPAAKPAETGRASEASTSAAASAATPNRTASGSPTASAAASATASAKPTEPPKTSGTASSGSAAGVTGPSIRSEPTTSSVPKAGVKTEPLKTEAARAEPTKPADPIKPAESSISSDAPKAGESAKASPAAVPEAAGRDGVSQPGPAPLPTPPAARQKPEAIDPPRRRSSAGAVLIAGLLGGILGALLAVGIDRFYLTDQGTPERIAGLERRIAELSTGPGPLAPRVSALESGVKQASDEARAASQKAAEALARPAGSPAAGPDQEARSGLQALTGRVQDGATRTAANTTALGELGQKVDAMGKASSDRLVAIARDVEAFTVHQKSLQADVATLRTGAATLDSRSAEADKRLVSLTDGLGRVSTDLAKLSPAAIQAGLRVVVSGRLDDALRHGTPLGPSVSALTKLGTEAPMLAALRPFADAPAPSPAALLSEFKPVATALTTEPARPDESWVDRGRRVLGKVVTVQTVGDGSGQDVPGLVARIESSLGRGSIAEAKAAWDALPEDKRRLGAAFGEKLGARAAAEDASRRIGAQSLSALDAATR